MTREEAIAHIQSGGRVAHPDFPHLFFYDGGGNIIIDNQGNVRDFEKLFPDDQRLTGWTINTPAPFTGDFTYEDILEIVGSVPSRRSVTFTPEDVARIRRMLTLYSVEELHINLEIDILTLRKIKKRRPPYNF